MLAAVVRHLQAATLELDGSSNITHQASSRHLTGRNLASPSSQK